MHKVLLLVSSGSDNRIVNSFILLDEQDLNLSIVDFILREVQEKHPESDWTANAIKTIESEFGTCFFKMRHCSLREGFFGVPGARPERMIVALHQDAATVPVPVEAAHVDPPMAEQQSNDESVSAASVDFINAQEDDFVSIETEEDDSEATVTLGEDERMTHQNRVILIEDSSPPAKRTKTQASHPIVTPPTSKKDGSFVKVLSNAQAWNILKDKFGFTFIEGRYCLPCGHGRFQSLAELRNDLCKHGIPDHDSNVSATEEDICNIRIWVRFAIVKDLQDGESISTDLWDDMKFMDAWSALGFTYTGGTYCVPVCDPTSRSSKIIRFQSSRTVEVENYFARFGVCFPDDRNLDEEARLRIDLFFANRPNDSTVVAEAVNTFERVELDDKGWPIWNRKRASRRNGKSHGEF